MMSQDELRQQHETINIMAQQIKAIKRMFALWPVFVALGSLISAVVGVTLAAYKYDGNLTKKPEFEAHLKIENANAKSTSRSLIIDSTEIASHNQRLTKLEDAPKYRLTNVIKVKDKHGNTQEREVN